MYKTHKYLTVFLLVFGSCLLFSLELGGQILSKEQRNFKEDLLQKVQNQSKGLLGAIASNDQKYIEDYFSQDGRIDKIGKETFLLSIVLNATQCIDGLITSGLSIDDYSKDNNLLVHAVENNSVEALEHLVELGINKYPQLENGYTLMHYATSIGRSEIINKLVDIGLEIDQTEESNGSTCLHLAVKNGFNDCLWVLLNRQANTKIPDNNGNLPIHIAINKADISALKNLLSFGADLSIGNENKQLPLHIAIEEQNEELLNFLLTFTSKLENEDSDVDVWKLAKKTKNKKIEKIIKSRISAEKKFYAFANFVSPTCSDNCNGYIAINAVGGKAPYSYQWDHDPQLSDNDADNLCPNRYLVTVEDSKKKKFLVEIDLSLTNEISLSFDKIDIGNWNGKELVVSKLVGGIPPFEFYWEDEAGSRNKSLSKGNYELRVEDNASCSKTASINIEGGKFVEPVLETEEKIDQETKIETAMLEEQKETIELSVKNDAQPATETKTIVLDNSEINFDLPDNQVLSLFEDDQVNVVVQSSRGTELGRYTIGEYLSRLRLLNKYIPTVIDTRKNDSGKIVLVKVFEKVK